MKRRTGEIYAEVCVNVEDVLSEVEDDDIEAEYNERGLGAHNTPSVSLVGLVRERHDSEHSGNLACCPDRLCDAVGREIFPTPIRLAEAAS